MWLRDLLLKKKVFSSLNKNKRTGISRFAVMVLASVLMCGGSQVFALSCSVGSSSWNNGYLVNVTVLNDGNSSVSQWAVQLHYQQTPAVANYWSADITTSGKVVAAGNLAWNGNLAPGQSTTFGIVGTHTGSFSEPSCTTDTASSSSTSASSSSSSSSRSSIASASSVSVNSSSYSYGSYGYSSYSGAVASSVPGGISGIAPPVSTSSVASVAPEIDAEETHF